MTIYDVIIDDHAGLLRLIHWLEDVDCAQAIVPGHEEQLATLDRCLMAHLRAEKEVVCDRLRAGEGTTVSEVLGQVDQVHYTMEMLLDELRAARSDRELRLAKLQALRVLLLQHVEDTEKVLLPELRRRISGQDEFRLGATLVGRKSELSEPAAEPDSPLWAA